MKISFKKFNKLAEKIYRDIMDSNLQLDGIICILNGGFNLAYYLHRKLDLPIYFIKIKSYTKSNEQKALELNLWQEVKPGHYLIVDDIYDTGKTIDFTELWYNKCTFKYAVLVSKKLVSLNYLDYFVGEFNFKQEWVDFWWEVK